MNDELVARCDLCKEPLDVTPVVLWKWVLHPECAAVAKERLERFAATIFDMTDEEYEAWLRQDEERGEWPRPSGLQVEYKVGGEGDP